MCQEPVRGKYMSQRIRRSTSSLTLKTLKMRMMKITRRKTRSCPPMKRLLHPALQIPTSQIVVQAHRQVPQAFLFQREKKEKSNSLLSSHGGVGKLYLQKVRGHSSPQRHGSILPDHSLLLVKAHLSGVFPPGWSCHLPADIFLLPLKEAHLLSQRPLSGLSPRCGLFLLLATGAPELDSLPQHSELNTEPTALLVTSTGNQALSPERAGRWVSWTLVRHSCEVSNSHTFSTHLVLFALFTVWLHTVMSIIPLSGVTPKKTSSFLNLVPSKNYLSSKKHFFDPAASGFLSEDRDLDPDFGRVPLWPCLLSSAIQIQRNEIKLSYGMTSQR